MVHSGHTAPMCIRLLPWAVEPVAACTPMGPFSLPVGKGVHSHAHDVWALRGLNAQARPFRSPCQPPQQHGDPGSLEGRRTLGTQGRKRPDRGGGGDTGAEPPARLLMNCVPTHPGAHMAQSPAGDQCSGIHTSPPLWSCAAMRRTFHLDGPLSRDTGSSLGLPLLSPSRCTWPSSL